MTELHVHLDGSLRPVTVWEEARRQRIDLGIEGLSGMHREDAAEAVTSHLRVPADCRQLTDYLECFRMPLMILQRAEAITRAVKELADDLAADGVDKAEIRFAPLSFCGGDLTAPQAITAAVSGMKEARTAHPGMHLSLIICCMRGQEEAPFIGSARSDLNGKEANFRLLDTVRDFKGDIVRAVDLAGAEALYPTELYLELFAYARKLELPFTIHAGEAAGAESVRAALQTGTGRIGHGVRAIEDTGLVDELARRKTVLECCVTSNFHTGCFPSPEAHPVKRLFDAGVRITLNTDNRTVSGTTMHKEIETVQRLYGFTDADIRTMDAYAEEALF